MINNEIIFKWSKKNRVVVSRILLLCIMNRKIMNRKIETMESIMT